MANNFITSELVDGAFNLLNGALEFLNTGLGTTLTQVTLFSGAIYGLVSKIGAMKIIPAIVGQFKNFANVIAYTAGGAGTLTESMAVFGGALGSSLPIILAVVAAVTLLKKGIKALEDSKDYDLQLSKLQEVEEEYTNIQERIKELESYNGDLTQSEERELEVLKKQTAELEKQIEKRKRKADKALTSERDATITGYDIEQLSPLLDPYIVSYNAVERQFENLATQAKEGKQNTRAYKKEVEDFVNTYGELADELATAAENGRQLDDTDLQIITTVSMARAELDYLNETYSESVDITEEANNSLQSFLDKYVSLTDKIQSATDALQKFKDATSTDYSAPIKGYQEAFDNLSAEIEAGTANIDEVKAGVELYLPEGTLESLNYDLEAAAELLGETFTGKLGTVLSTEDPIGGLVKVIQEGNGKLQTESGRTAATIDANGRLSIESYELLAKALGTNVEVAEALGLAIQDQSSQYFFTNQEVRNMSAALYEVGIRSTSAQTDMNALVSTISNVAQTADPTVIKAWVDALKETGAINPNVKVTTEGIAEALSDVDNLEDKVDDVPEQKTTTITATVEHLDDVQQLSEALKHIYTKQATITSNLILRVNGRPVSLAEYMRIPRDAKGTNYSSGGLALVNDGAPINGSSAELIVEGNTARIANGGKMGITDLERGAKVYTAAQTQQILKNSQNGSTDLGALLNGIQAFGTGTTGADVSRYLDSTTLANYNPKASGTIKPSTSDPEKRKEEFDKWLKEKKHYLAMDMITEEEYYRDLEIMNERFLKGQKDYLDEYWQHQEEIYEYQKRDLQDIVQLEEKLNNLAKAKTQKVLVYKNGMFQYVQNTEAIAKAQRAVTGYANGTTHATAGVHMVGENGAELRVLNEGDGIIPSNITKNLMRLGSIGLSGFNKLGNNEINNFNIQNVKLEKINDVDELFTGLKNLAMQTATART